MFNIHELDSICDHDDILDHLIDHALTGCVIDIFDTQKMKINAVSGNWIAYNELGRFDTNSDITDIMINPMVNRVGRLGRHKQTTLMDFFGV